MKHFWSISWGLPEIPFKEGFSYWMRRLFWTQQRVQIWALTPDENPFLKGPSDRRRKKFQDCFVAQHTFWGVGVDTHLVLFSPPSSAYSRVWVEGWISNFCHKQFHLSLGIFIDQNLQQCNNKKYNFYSCNFRARLSSGQLNTVLRIRLDVFKISISASSLPKTKSFRGNILPFCAFLPWIRTVIWVFLQKAPKVHFRTLPFV